MAVLADRLSFCICALKVERSADRPAARSAYPQCTTGAADLPVPVDAILHPELYYLSNGVQEPLQAFPRLVGLPFRQRVWDLPHSLYFCALVPILSIGCGSAGRGKVPDHVYPGADRQLVPDLGRAENWGGCEVFIRKVRHPASGLPA